MHGANQWNELRDVLLAYPSGNVSRRPRLLTAGDLT